jgi:hypothetical protein
MKRPAYNLETRLAELNWLIQRLENKIKMAPTGFIQYRDGHFYRRIEKNFEYLGKDKDALIKALIQKKYDIGQLDAAKQEKLVIEKALKGFCSIKTKKFPDELMKYVNLEEYTDEAYIKEWCNRDNWDFSRQAITGSQNYTQRGEHVRSKSEVIIADRLNNAKIPYHYEICLELVIGDRDITTVKPDFTVLNTRTLETWYWEHFGMIDDEKYRYEMKRKLDSYAINGIFPGNHLIVSFETKDNQLNIQHINRLIKEYLK